MTSNSDVMIRLKNQLSEILPFIDDKHDVVLLDYPMHYNIGDLLIFLGEIHFFNLSKVDLTIIQGTASFNVEALKKYLTENTTILCHGGGNFGDLYHVHQKLREDVVRNFPKNKVIILPQTAHFSNIENQLQSQKIFKQHQNLVMFARDEETLNLFNEFTDKAFLMPDMAHALYGSLSRNQQKNFKTLYFLRKDIEKNKEQLAVEKKLLNEISCDWEDLITFNDKCYLYMVDKLARLNKKFIKNKVIDRVIYQMWYRKCTNLVNKFSFLFSSYDRVITSRLHGHILSCLVDTPSIVLDNNYGKNSKYYNLWTSKSQINDLQQIEKNSDV